MGRWDTIERKEYLLKVFVGHTWAMIAYLNYDPGKSKRTLLAHRDFYVRAGVRIPDSVTHYVLDRSTQLFPCARSRARALGVDFDGTVLGLSLEVPVDGDFLNQAAQLHRFLAARVGAAVDSSQCEELANQLIEVFHFEFDPIKIFLPLLGGTLP